MNYNKMDLLPLLAIVFILSGTALGAYISFNFRKQNLNNQNNLRELNQEINSIVTNSKLLNDEILDLTKTSAGLSKEIQGIVSKSNETSEKLKILSEKTNVLVSENIKLTDKSKELTEFILNYTTGGGSIPVVLPGFYHKEKPFKYFFMLKNEGEYPIYDIHVNYFDLSLEPQLLGQQEYLSQMKQIRVPNLAVDGATQISKILEVPENNKVDIQFTIITRNGTFRQNVHLRKSTKYNNMLSFAYKLTKMENGFDTNEIIKSSISPDFPPEEKSQLDWAPKI